MSFNHLVLKGRTFLSYSSACVKAFKCSPSIKEEEKKKTLEGFCTFCKKKKSLSFFFTITKISSKHTDPTVSLLNYIERVQPLTVSGAHQS